MIIALIDIRTKEEVGLFATYAKAMEWVATYGTGNKDDYRLFPW